MPPFISDILVLPHRLLRTGTPILEKGVSTLHNSRIATTPLFSSTEYGFIHFADAPREIDFWKTRLKEKLGNTFQEEKDGNASLYVVIPSIGSVAPI